MANQITDNRTPVDAADSVTSYVGSASPVLDNDVYVEGSGSIAEQMTNSLRYVMYNAGSAQNWSNNVFYLWVNCGVVGLLATKASGGFRIRFAGATITDYFEVYVGGSDAWPNSVQGGWVQFVVDIETARSTAVTNGWTGGTTPATTAIQYVGYAAVTSVMTKVADNTWLDAIWRLPDGSPGIIVEGRSGGTVDWTIADIFTQLGAGAGSFRPGPGGSWVCNTPIQFGINDTTTHGFSDSNQLVLWDDQEYAPADLYKLSALGNVGGVTSIAFGVKSGTGDAATGAQGVTFAAASGGVRWAIDFNDPNLDAVGMYGCTFIHGGAFLLDDPAVEVISSQYIDVSSVLASNSLQQRNKIINAATATGVAFMTTDDLGDLVFCEFEHSAGHAVELTTPIVATQISKGNKFSGYGAIGTNEAALYNNAGGAVTVNVTNAGDTPTYRNGTSASTTVNNNVSVTLTGMRDNTEVRVYSAGTTTELAGIEDATAGTTDARTFTFALSAGLDVDIAIFNKAYKVPPNNRINGYTVPTTDTELPITQIPDPTYSNPV